MQLRLTIDEGNTTARAVAWQDGSPVGRLVSHRFDRRMAGEVLSRWPGIGAAIYSSTVGCHAEACAALRSAGVRLVELGSDTPLPIGIGYRTPGTLGPDRIAAAAGGYALCPGRRLLIADMGTAVTYDTVDPDGCFRGGNIAPGVVMRLQALHRFTAVLPEVDPQGDCPQWGYDTPTAMRAGAVRGVAAELAHYRSLLPADAVTFVTGGDADTVLPHIDFAVRHEPNLVDTGLLSILTYNEAD